VPVRKAVPVNKTASVETAAKRSGHVASGDRQRGGQRTAQPATADNGQARTGIDARNGIPFRFSQRRYRSAPESTV
jgi:hypothetical protein